MSAVLPENAPTWATEDTGISHDRGGDVAPVDACTTYQHQVGEAWNRTPECSWLPAEPIRLVLYASRYDSGEHITTDNVEIWLDDTPEITLVAVDARRLGLALLDAADLLEKEAGR